MSTPTIRPDSVGFSGATQKFLFAVGGLSVLTAGFLLAWPSLRPELLARNFLPHRFCYLGDLGLVWTHVIADSLIALAYLAISITLAYLVYVARSAIPMHWMLLAFGLFIVACGGTHLVEVITVWIPVYILSATVKGFTAVVSLTTAAVLPFTVPRVLRLVQSAKESEQNMASLRASEERKEALLREVHHRVKNNLAVVCSLFYLQSNRAKDQQTAEIFSEMESRVHSMALVHEILYGSENLARINFGKYAESLVRNIHLSHGVSSEVVKLSNQLDQMTMSVDLAVPCGLILNELVSNAFKHAFPQGRKGQISLGLKRGQGGHCCLCVQDNGVGIPSDLDLNTTASLGLRLVNMLTGQIRGSFELTNQNPGTLACLEFTVDEHEQD